MSSVTVAQTGEQTAEQAALGMDIQEDEVIVTARLREENLQKVPLSAQVVARRISEQNIDSLGALSQLLSGVKFEPTGRSNEQYIRGIGSGNNGSFNQSVSVVIDDVYHGRSRASALMGLLDLDRIEVLKGPQSTYFGNNSIAGTINVVTRKPGEKFDLATRALYGDFGTYAFEGAMSGRLSNSFAVRAAVISNGQDGYLRNVFNGQKTPNEDNKAARVSFLYEPSGRFDALLKLEGSKYNQSGGLVQQLENCPPDSRFVPAGFCNAAIVQGVPTGIDNELNGFPAGQSTELDTAEGVLTLNYRFENSTLKSISAYNTYDYNLGVAGNPTATALLTATVPEDYSQVSQELRITSDEDGTFDYVAGLLFLREQLSLTQDTNFLFLTPPPALSALAPFTPIGQEIAASLPTKTYSVYGALGMRATDNLKLTVGLRASSVEKDINRVLFYGTATQPYGGIVPFPDPSLQTVASGLGLGIATAQTSSRTDDAVTPSAQIQYDLSSDAMVYLSYTRGFKAGGFNAVDTTGNLANLPYNPEYVNAYEIGTKTQWMDGALTANIAAFYGEYSGLQVTANSFLQNGAIISTVQNAASAISQGVEGELRWTITPNFRLGLEGTYLDAHYGRYPNAGPTQAQQRAGQRIQDLSGQPTALAPKWSGSLLGAYIQPFGGDYRLTTEVSLFGSSKYFLGGSGVNDDLLMQGAFGRVDGRLALQRGSWTAEVIGKNLTDRSIRLAGSAVPTALGSVIVSREYPRSVFGQIRYNFAP